MSVVHYAPSGRGNPCGASGDWFKRHPWPINQPHKPPETKGDPRPKTITNVARVTCPQCLRWIVDTASAQLVRIT